nr:protein phosphatase 2C domain-containing protein [Microbacterium sp. CFBP 8794]
MQLNTLDLINDAGSSVVASQDRIGANSHTLWAVDGATPASGGELNTSKDVYWLVDTVSRMIQSSQREEDLAVLLSRIAGVVADELDPRQVHRNNPPSCSVLIARVNGDRLSWVCLGDISLAVQDGHSHRLTVVENDVMQRREVEVIAARADLDDARFATFLTKRRESDMNTPHGYWVLAAKRDIARHARYGQISISPESTVVAATDGFARGVQLFHLFSWQDMLDKPDEVSLTDRCRDIRDIECRPDPRNRFPRIKISDDAAAVLVRVV